MTPRLTLTVLVDNTTLTDNDQLQGESGLSFFLRSRGRSILFDTGISGLFLTNAEKMGIGHGEIDTVVLSHGHNDHTGGLSVLAESVSRRVRTGSGAGAPELIAHPRCFWPKENAGRRNGSAMSDEDAQQAFRLRMSDAPVWLTDDLVFLGEIPRRFAFEATDPGKRTVLSPDGEMVPDFLTDDSALAFRSDEGLVIITGCSHAGICNITEYAREVFGEKHVRDIIGGLHLLTPEPHRLEKTGKYLNRLHLEALHACHCTSLPAKLALARYCPMQEAGVGLRLEW